MGRWAVLWCEDWRERSTVWSSRAGRHSSSTATHASMSSRPPAPGAGCGGVCAGDCDGSGGSAMIEMEKRGMGDRFASNLFRLDKSSSDKEGRRGGGARARGERGGGGARAPSSGGGGVREAGG